MLSKCPLDSFAIKLPRRVQRSCSANFKSNRRSSVGVNKSGSFIYFDLTRGIPGGDYRESVVQIDICMSFSSDSDALTLFAIFYRVNLGIIIDKLY